MAFPQVDAALCEHGRRTKTILAILPGARIVRERREAGGAAPRRAPRRTSTPQCDDDAAQLAMQCATPVTKTLDQGLGRRSPVAGAHGFSDQWDSIPYPFTSQATIFWSLDNLFRRVLKICNEFLFVLKGQLWEQH